MRQLIVRRLLVLSTREGAIRSSTSEHSLVTKGKSFVQVEVCRQLIGLSLDTWRIGPVVTLIARNVPG